MEKVTLTIDGQKVQVDKDTTLMHAAEKIGIKIPSHFRSAAKDRMTLSAHM